MKNSIRLLIGLILVAGFFHSFEGVEAASPKAKKNRSSSSSRSSMISSSIPSSSSVSSGISSSTVSSSTSSSSSFTSSAMSSTGRIWGAYVGNQLTDAATFEALVGKTMNMQAIFVGGYDAFPSAYGPTVRDKGKTLVIFWEPSGLSLDSIIAGTLDSSVRSFVAGAAAYNGPIIFVPFHEMNGDWVSWGGTVGTNTPTKLINAWRRVHGLFSGVSNVKFGWAVNSNSVPDTSINAIPNYYPGDAYVDYTGVDCFNFGSPWLTFNQVCGNALTTIASYNKPELIFSMASAQGSLKATWITDALTTQMNQRPEIKGWIWFNTNKEQDWRVNSDAASLNAFKAVLP